MLLNLRKNRAKKNLEVNSPLQKAIEWAGDDFNKVFNWHLANGYMWSGNDSFIMGRPIPKDCLMYADQFIKWPLDICDVWFVWLGAGRNPFQRFLEVAPFKLPYVAWHRKKLSQETLKVWSWDQYDRVTKRFRSKKNGNNS